MLTPARFFLSFIFALIRQQFKKVKRSDSLSLNSKFKLLLSEEMIESVRELEFIFALKCCKNWPKTVNSFVR